MKANELREKDAVALKQEVKDLQRAYFNQRMQKATGSLANTASIKFARKDIARAKTILTEKLKGAAK